MTNDTYLAKWGNSLAVRIPQAIVRKARLAEGDRLSFDLAGYGSIILRSRHRKHSLDQLVVAIGRGTFITKSIGKRRQAKNSGRCRLSIASLYSLRSAVAGSTRRARRTGG